jgi:hypothetical protein
MFDFLSLFFSQTKKNNHKIFSLRICDVYESAFDKSKKSKTAIENRQDAYVCRFNAPTDENTRSHGSLRVPDLQQ